MASQETDAGPDPVLESLLAAWRAVARVADAEGVGPTTMNKSAFASDEDRAAFVDAWGQATYDALPE